MTVSNDLKHRNIQALDLFFGLLFARSPLLGNIAPERDCRQSLKGKNLSPKQQEILARIETQVGGVI